MTNKATPKLQNPPTYKQGNTELWLSLQPAVTVVPHLNNAQFWHNHLIILQKPLYKEELSMYYFSVDLEELLQPLGNPTEMH